MTCLCQCHVSRWDTSNKLNRACVNGLAFLHLCHCHEKSTPWQSAGFRRRSIRKHMKPIISGKSNQPINLCVNECYFKLLYLVVACYIEILWQWQYGIYDIDTIPVIKVDNKWQFTVIFQIKSYSTMFLLKSQVIYKSFTFHLCFPSVPLISHQIVVGEHTFYVSLSLWHGGSGCKGDKAIMIFNSMTIYKRIKCIWREFSKVANYELNWINSFYI